VGRDEACDVVLLEQAASRHHARLERHGDEIRVIDCDSANGVWVGAERVVGSRVLHDGEVVRIGDTTLTLVLDPHRQPTLYRAPAEERPGVTSTATSPPIPPALVAPHRPAPVPAASSLSAYSLGSGPTLASESGPDRLGVHEPSSPSTYSLGAEPTLASQSGPNHLGVHEPSAPSMYSIGEAPTIAPHVGPSDRPLVSSGSVYSLGNEPAAAAREPDSFGEHLPSSRSAYSLGNEPAAAAREPDAFGQHLPSSRSAYSLGNEPAAAAREPDSFGEHLPSSRSAYSLGNEPAAAAREPDAFGQHLPSSRSAYSLGNEPMGAFRGPDVLPPAPSVDDAASSAQLQAAPPRPGVIPPAPSPPPPAHVEPLRPPAFVAPPQARPAASSWGEWAEPMPSEHRKHGRTAGPALWLGLGLLIGGIAAMVVAVVAGYEPSELMSSIRAAVDPGGAR
jgi:pSer/pThr/pTyr-binding forkhead associated (FHA) protein